jgi:superfamily II DNA or RNA helicase
MSTATLPLFDAPSVAHRASAGPPTRDQLQRDMVDAVIGLIDRGVSSGILEAPRGFGKTACVGKLASRLRDERGWRTMFLVDERTLALQSEEALRLWGLRPTVEMADRRAGQDTLLAGDYDTVIATRQTLGRKESDRYGALLNRLRWPRVDLLVIDEAHCGPKGNQIKAVREMVRPRFTLGATATPYLASGERLVPNHFDAVAYSYPLEDHDDGRPGAISNGHLVPPVTWDCKTSVDLAGLKSTMTEHGRDYKAGDLDRVIGEHVSELVNAARMDLEAYGPFNRAMHFASSVALARAFADVWTQIGYRAAAVWGDHPDKDGVLRRYREGEYRVLCVCQMGVKGFDDPPTDALIMARPTKSYPLARQMLGRGLRLSPATDKERCLVLGFAWNCGKSGGPVSVLDIFIEGLPDPDVKAAATRLRQQARGPVDVNKLVKEAKAEAERLKADRLRKIRLAATRRDVRHATRERAIFALRNLPARLERLPDYSSSSPIPVTKDQKERARALGIGTKNLAGHTAASFEAKLRVWEGRREAGFSSYPQRNAIKYLDPSVSDERILNMTLREAGALIDELKRRQ